MQTKRRQQHSPMPRAHRPEYVAVVRMPDGTRDTFHVRFADSIDDARDLVRLEVGEARAILVAERG